MPSPGGLLLLTNDADTERAVALSVEVDPDIGATVVVNRDVRALRSQLESRPVPIVLADLEPDPFSRLEELAPLVKSYPSTRFVILCRELRADVVVSGMQAGARDCLLKESIGTELPGVLRRLLADGKAAATGSGQIVTVLSARGGCGGTTVAVNVADELSRRTEKGVLLLDFDLHFGSAGTYLGVEGRYGIAEIIQQRGTIDAQLVSSTAVKYSDHLHVLSNPARAFVADAKPLGPEHLEMAVRACRQAFPVTVVDAPRAPLELSHALARASALTFVVMQQRVVDVRNARALVTALLDRRIRPESIVAVVNRFEKRGPIVRLEDVREAISEVPIETVRNHYATAVRSMDLGQPLAVAAPRSEMRRDLEGLAALVEKHTTRG